MSKEFLESHYRRRHPNVGLEEMEESKSPDRRAHSAHAGRESMPTLSKQTPGFVSASPPIRDTHPAMGSMGEESLGNLKDMFEHFKEELNSIKKDQESHRELIKDRDKDKERDRNRERERDKQEDWEYKNLSKQDVIELISAAQANQPHYQNIVSLFSV